jgi:hypothetical protein
MPAGMQAQGESPGDTVIVRVTSPRGAEVTFSGVVTLREAESERRIESQRTPFELRFPRQDLDARFTADDGGALSGEIVVHRARKKPGRAWGTVNAGAVNLFARGLGYGFGDWRRLRPGPFGAGD